MLLLALPGFIVVYTYKGRLRPQDDALVSSGSMTMGWVVSLAAAGLAHAVWIPVADYYSRHWGSGAQADLGSILFLLSGEYKDTSAFEKFVRSITDYPYSVFFYFATLYFLVALVGLCLNRFVLGNQLDLKVGFLRFNNKWHYLFGGDQFPRKDAVWVTVTCCHKTQTCLYAGLLKTYEFSQDGEIERLTLEYAQRAEFKGTIDFVPKFVAIPGDRFVIWCRDVNTLNLQYVVVNEDDTDAGAQKQLPLKQGS